MQNPACPKPMAPHQMEETLALVWQVFNEFEAAEYSAEGIEEFKAYIQPQHIRALLHTGGLRIWTVCQNGAVVGMLAGDDRGHIHLLFVEGKHHRRGIARSLFEAYLAHCRARGRCNGPLRVHASPYAVPAYRAFGYIPTGPEQTVNGLRFVPMERPLI